jgi:hypothetical protein
MKGLRRLNVTEVSFLLPEKQINKQRPEGQVLS